MASDSELCENKRRLTTQFADMDANLAGHDEKERRTGDLGVEKLGGIGVERQVLRALTAEKTMKAVNEKIKRENGDGNSSVPAPMQHGFLTDAVTQESPRWAKIELEIELCSVDQQLKDTAVQRNASRPGEQAHNVAEEKIAKLLNERDGYQTKLHEIRKALEIAERGTARENKGKWC